MMMIPSRPKSCNRLVGDEMANGGDGGVSRGAQRTRVHQIIRRENSPEVRSG